ncbi:hypothetical protein J7E50_18135 [Pedobacter sp. ISL-68]|uniref:hypothetical protein n=1 Tax=unclassified Pedobacter TaxID=2628915 RepID=UPI001BE7A1F3|nr:MULTISPECIES: hypothetical protein [unclassified Pedobacter]MBT2559844.1 hypothetical protein [Pedobacter sp. ISL-64]MBT2592149.1 hypothetical protein [Pedobacter sp. ISL-68]
MPRSTPATSITRNLTTVLTKNLALLLILPTLLGGCEQFVTLCLKSFTLLLYYSPTQVPIDGISILVKVPIFLLGVFVNLKYHEARTNIKANWGTLVFLSIFILMLIALTVVLFVREDYKLLIKIAYLIIANIAVILLLKKDKTVLQTFSKKATYVIAVSIVLATFYNVLTKRDYSEVGNITNLTDKLKAKYPNAKLLYSNDKYLFYDRDTTQFSTIARYEIVSTEKLFLESYDLEKTETDGKDGNK